MIVSGNSLDYLPTHPEKSVQLCVTSPPYFQLRNYGTPPVRFGGDPNCGHRWHQSKATLLHDNRNALHGKQDAVIGERGQTHINSKTLLFSSTCEICGMWEGQLGLEPTVDMFVEHLLQIFKGVKRVLRDDGVLFVNMGDSYGNGRKGMANKSLLMVPERFAIAMCDDGWTLRNKIVWAKQEYNGKDNKVYGKALPSSATDRLSSAWEVIYFFSKTSRCKSRIGNVGLPYTEETVGRINRAFKLIEKTGAACTDDNKSEWDKPCETGSDGLRHRVYSKFLKDKAPLEMVRKQRRKLPDLWRINTQSFRGAHYATYPPLLPLLPILMFTDPGDVVLDPFAGSGTTLKVTDSLKRVPLGIEIGEANVEIINHRMREDAETHFIRNIVKESFPDVYAELFPADSVQLSCL